MEEKIIHYDDENLRVVWKPKTCIHSEKCWRGLGQVFKPRDKPWVQLDGANHEDIIEQVKKCPSGALSYEILGEEIEKSNASIEAQVIENGPLLIQGEVKINLPSGECKTQDQAAFCRCGASSNKPFCDGSHKRSGFIG